MMQRLPDWQNRLSAWLAGIARQRFAPGELDCAIFAAGAVQAQTGLDLAANWRGRYRTLRNGLAHLRREGFADHVALVAAHLPEVAVSEARPGDIAVLDMGGETPVLGVFQGSHVYVLIEDGMGFTLLPAEQVLRAFRVGQ
jgi:hypothetical protein